MEGKERKVQNPQQSPLHTLSFSSNETEAAEQNRKSSEFFENIWKHNPFIDRYLKSKHLKKHSLPTKSSTSYIRWGYFNRSLNSKSQYYFQSNTTCVLKIYKIKVKSTNQ